jgi:spore photoproduct lyase
MVDHQVPLNPVIKRRRKSGFVELFRTTPTRTVCPNFYVLRHANGCRFEPSCSYCYLKSSFWYLDKPHVFINKEDLLKEVRAWIQRDDLESYVLNSGNLSDSLAFEIDRPITEELVRLFREDAESQGRPHSLLVVTKAGLEPCKPLMVQPASPNVIVSFSFNSPEAAAALESGAAPIEERVEAARELKCRGWRLRIRLDPIIHGFDYRAIARQIRDLAPELVTLGTLRAERGLRRFLPPNLAADLEQSAEPRGLDRYPLSERIALYRQAADLIGGGIQLGLCEETREMWEAVVGDWKNSRCNCSL